MKRGIDISRWQGNVDFAKVKADGIDFVILRSSYRQTVDPMFHEYVKGCKTNGILIYGVYHFIYALNEQQALEEAKFCVEQVKQAGLGKGTFIFSDFEYDTVTDAAEKGVILGRNECNKFTQIFCEYAESQGYNAGIYSNIDYYKHWYDHELLAKYHFWLADYTGGPDYPCLIQQYTSKGQVNGINGNVDMNYYYGVEMKPVKRSRQAVVDLVRSWEGRNEADGSFKYIIDIYNSYSGAFPRGTKMQYDWSWCACTWSALAIKLGYTDVMPIEISCGYLIEAAKKMDCWKENDGYLAQPGDAILYDWQDSGTGENTAWPDHVGVIIETNKDSGYFVVMEGNYNNAVKKRTISINGRYIRGFITPKYSDNAISKPIQTGGKDIETIAREVIAGTWGTGAVRKERLEAAGYDYSKIQAKVNLILNGSTAKPLVSTATATREVIATCSAKKFDQKLAGQYKATSNLHLRNDAGVNKKSLCVIPKGTKVQCYGYHNLYENVKWLYIEVTLDKVKYVGFSSSEYLKK